MHEHDIEGELDAALARYAAVEPRGGLEQRVLSNLRAQHTRATQFAWRRLAAAGFAVAALASLPIWVGEEHRGAVNVEPAIVQHETQESRGSISAAAAKNDLALGGALEHSQKKSSTKRAERRETDIARTTAEVMPKLAQFPAPEPLTDQEKLLIRFVQQDPGDAVLVAQETMERLRREAEEMERLGPSTPTEPQEQ